MNFMKTDYEITMLGSSVPVTAITSASLIAKLCEVAAENETTFSSLKLYERARFKGINYTTESYCQATKTCTYYISIRCTGGKTEVVKAIYFVSISKEINLIIGKYVNLTGSKFITKAGESVRHLQKYVVSNTFIVRNVKDIECPMFKSLTLLSKPPNLHELHM